MAWLRMCSSSPMFRPWAARSKTSTGPRRSSSAPSRGPSSSRKNRSRSIDSSSPTPNHSVLPGPSLSVEKARCEPSATTQTGIDGEHTPVIGPTWSCSLPGSSAISPRSSAAVAASRFGSQPSNSTAATSARRCGSQTRSHVIGGPECSSRPSRMPGTTSRAGATVTARGDAPSIAATAREFASRDRVAVRAPEPREQRDRVRVAARRRPPVDVDDRRALRPQRVGERREAEVDRGDLAQHVHGRAASMAPMDDLVAIVRNAPGLLGKRDLQVVKRLGVDGDDAAAVPHGDGYLIVCGEAMSPPFLQGGPVRRRRGRGGDQRVRRARDGRHAARRSSTCSSAPTRRTRTRVLDGMTWASEKLGVPIVGGHLTLGHEPALSASCTGFANRPLRASNAQPGDTLVAAFATEGRWMSETQPFWTSLHDRDDDHARTRRRRAGRDRREPGSRMRRETCRCPASPARCCR